MEGILHSMVALECVVFVYRRAEGFDGLVGPKTNELYMHIDATYSILITRQFIKIAQHRGDGII